MQEHYRELRIYVGIAENEQDIAFVRGCASSITQSEEGKSSGCDDIPADLIVSAGEAEVCI